MWGGKGGVAGSDGVGRKVMNVRPARNCPPGVGEVQCRAVWVGGGLWSVDCDVNVGVLCV